MAEFSIKLVSDIMFTLCAVRFLFSLLKVKAKTLVASSSATDFKQCVADKKDLIKKFNLR